MKHYLFAIFCIFYTTTALFGAEIAVVTIAQGTEFKKTVQCGTQNKIQYCEKHGYDFIYAEESLDPTRPIPWSKIPLILNAMENEEYKWIFWTDADALFMNMAVQLEDLTDENYNFIITKDLNGINTGHFLIKNCQWSREFLEAVYAHTECLHHWYWEQQGIIEELNQNPKWLSSIKFIPQRLMNSYSSEIIGNSLIWTYHPGDFIIHFAGTRASNVPLKSLMEKYSLKVVDNLDLLTLDYYLGVYGFQLSPQHSHKNEGYMTNPQKQEFIERLKEYPNIKSIAEIGLNGGHSAETFFQNCSKIEKFVSFDLNQHDYTKAAVNFFKRRYKDKFSFVEGDSAQTVAKYAVQNPKTKFDLIYIDGNHSYQGCLNDIQNCAALANSKTILWIDDYHGDTIQRAVKDCEKAGLIKIVMVNHSYDPCGERSWVEACYLK